MSEHEARVAAVCEAAGVAFGYHRIDGRWIETPLASRIALLAALGIDASTPADCDAAIHALEVGRWSRLVGPVAVVAADDAGWRVELRLPRSALDAPVRWRVVAESGETWQGECRGSELAGLGGHAIGDTVFERRALAPGIALGPGHHRLECRAGDGEPVSALLLAAPADCWRPGILRSGGRMFGLSAQLHSVRSDRDWGIGDFGDLLRLIEFAARARADFVGLNPLHALFADAPERASPYSPSSRIWLNPLYIDVDAALRMLDDRRSEALVASPDFQARLRSLRDAPLIDRIGVARVKDQVLRGAWRAFRDGGLASGIGPDAEFGAFRVQGGRALRIHALHEAIQADLRARGEPCDRGWQDWPEPLRDPDAPAVEAFERAHADELGYREFLQWIARLQLTRAADRCLELGMRVGLYQDLAVSIDAGGSDAWRARSAHALGVGVGAPPDDWNRTGQDWGLPPLLPERLRECGFAPWVRALRSAMQGAGALRIDHVMQLMRLYWVPAGMAATEGGYVRYPLDEMAAIVAIESRRQRCAVIGEDLGTVADEMRAAMHRYGMLSCKLLYFERAGWGEFRPASEYPREALVGVSTHDLPTLAGWWRGRDLDLIESLGLFPPEQPPQRLREERAHDRARLLRALGLDPAWADGPMRAGLAEAAHAFLASTPACLMAVQLEDLALEIEQANLPGTVHEHPNWLRKLSVTLDTLATDPTALAVLRAVAAHRGRAAGAV